MRLIDELQPAVSAVLSTRLNADDPAPVAVALSGGGDSVALLWMAADWARSAGRRLLALTVDHGLQPESRRWTAEAGAIASRAGAEWRALYWEGEKPATGLPAAARSARHRLIGEAARHAGASVVLVGHTADDILESQLMRASGSTTPDPQEWAPSPVWPEGRGVFLLRPLLAIGREALREWLADRGESWLDDPANADLRYARARARLALEAGPAPVAAPSGASNPQLLDGATPTPDGRLVVGRAGLGADSRRLLSRALVCVAGGTQPPRTAQIVRLFERIAAGERFTATLAGARVDADEVDVTFSRDPGERARGGLANVELANGSSEVWDGRFAVRAEAEGSVVALAGLMSRLPRRDREALKRLPPGARAALPAWIGATGEVALPRPFGTAPAEAECLVGARLAGACGFIVRERDIRARTIDDGAGALCALS